MGTMWLQPTIMFLMPEVMSTKSVPSYAEPRDLAVRMNTVYPNNERIADVGHQIP
jgi:hypothetical protein